MWRLVPLGNGFNESLLLTRSNAEELLNKLKEIAEKESAITKYSIEATDVVIRALLEFVERYNKVSKKAHT